MTPTSYDDAFVSSRCEVLTIGTLNLPSGKVVACDPFFCYAGAAFDATVRPGRYEVQLCRAESQGFGKRIALARLLLTSEVKATTYEKAVSATATGYVVESGLGSFMDELTRQQFAAVLARHYDNAPDANYYDDKLAAELKKSALNPDDPDDTGTWAMHALPGSELNVAIFASGMGDGTYESFWGFDSNRQIVSLTTDFQIL
jgi:uncharacterized protein DUF4241